MHRFVFGCSDYEFALIVVYTDVGFGKGGRAVLVAEWGDCCQRVRKVGVAKDVPVDYGPGCCKTEVGGCNRLDDGAVR